MELEIDGRQIYAATGGRPFNPTSPVIVFLHGAGMDHTNWQLPARWFAWHNHAVLAVDLPGHGRSEGPNLTTISDMGRWVGALLDAARIDRAALVGHSMGAAVALEAAAALGPRVTRLGLIGTSSAIPVHKDLLAAAKESPERAYQLMIAWAHVFGAKMGGHPVPGMWMTGGTLALFRRNRPGVLHVDLAACDVWTSGADAAKRIKCPALIVAGAKDIMTSSKGSAQLAELIDGSRSVTLANCGHMVMAEAPDELLDLLIEFFGQAKAAA